MKTKPDEIDKAIRLMAKEIESMRSEITTQGKFALLLCKEVDKLQKDIDKLNLFYATRTT